MKDQLLSKILNKDGSLIWKYSKPTTIQKYLTENELKYLESCYGKTLSEKYFCLKNNLPNGKTCPACGRKVKFISFKEGYHNYCSYSCRSKSAVFTEESKLKRRTTNLKKYNTECSLNKEGSKEKRFKTNQERYGSNSPFSSSKVKEKADNTIINKYRSKSILYNNIVKNSKNGYGFGNKEIAKKCANTCLKRYDVANYKQYPLEKERQSLRSKEIIKKSIQKQKEKYGTIWLNSVEGQKFNRQAKYMYKNEKFDSSWELYYWLWCNDHNIPIKRNYKYFNYQLDNKKKRFYPDFLINDSQLIEIKGDHLINDVYHDSIWQEKEKICIKENIQVLKKDDIVPIIKEIQAKYGKKFVSQFKQKTASSFKRKIIEFTSLDDIYQYRNSNVKFHYICDKCKRDVYTTYFIINHFNDMLCKHCRQFH